MLATLAARLADDLHAYIDERIQEIIKLAEQQDKLIADLARKAREDGGGSVAKMALPGVNSATSRGSMRRRPQRRDVEQQQLPSYKDLLRAMGGSPTGQDSDASPLAEAKAEFTPLRPYSKRSRISQARNTSSVIDPRSPEVAKPLVFDCDAEVVEVRSSPARSTRPQKPPKRPKIPLGGSSSSKSPLESIDENAPPRENDINTHRAVVPDPTRPEERPNERAVVRGRDARQQLDGYACPQCTAFYSAAGFDPQGNACTHGSSEAINAASRHRYYKPPTSTPSGFWDIWSFPPSPEGRRSSLGNTPVT